MSRTQSYEYVWFALTVRTLLFFYCSTIVVGQPPPCDECICGAIQMQWQCPSRKHGNDISEKMLRRHSIPPVTKDMNIHALLWRYRIPGNIMSREFLKPLLQSKNRIGALIIIEAGITRVEKDAFVDFPWLNQLRLSDNVISGLQPYTFNRMGISTFVLKNNPIKRLDYNIFGRLKGEHFDCTNCSLQIITYDAFANYTGLRWLLLGDNPLRTLEPRMELLFHNLVDLNLGVTRKDDSIFICNCSIAWLYRYYKTQEIIDDNKPPTCYKPISLRNQLLSNINKGVFECEIPKMTSMGIQLRHTRAFLLSQYTGKPTPEMRCKVYREDNNQWLGLLNENPPLGFSGNFTVYRHNKGRNSEIVCTLNNNAGSNVMHLSLGWQSDTPNVYPKEASSTKQNLTTEKPQSGDYQGRSAFRTSKTPIAEQPNFLYDKQFSLIEILGAVIGTFFGTLLICVCFWMLIRFYHKYPKDTQSVKYEAAYSGPSYQEYDMPQFKPYRNNNYPNQELVDFRTPQRTLPTAIR